MDVFFFRFILSDILAFENEPADILSFNIIQYGSQSCSHITVEVPSLCVHCIHFLCYRLSHIFTEEVLMVVFHIVKKGFNTQICCKRMQNGQAFVDFGRMVVQIF